MTITLSRASVPPGGQVLVWSHLGNLDPTAWRLVGPSGTVTPAWSQPSSGPVVYWTSAYCHQLTVPAGVAPGLYTLTNGDLPPAALTVTLPAPPRGKPTTLSPSASTDMAGAVARQLAKTDVDLAPGRYDFDRPVTIPAGRRLRGHGALVVCLGHFAFRCGDGVTLEDLAARGDGWLADVSPVPTNLTLTRCHFEGLDLAAGRGLQSVDCTWDRCGAILGTEHYHLRPRFTGTFPGSSTLLRGSGAAIVDGVWRDTDRGPCCQTHQGDVSDCLILHPDMSGLTHVFNGNEGVSAEGSGRFDRNVILHERYAGDGPAFQIMGPPSRDCVLREFQASSGGGVVLNSDPNEINIQLGGGELRSCSGINIGRLATVRFGWPNPAYPDGVQEGVRIINPLPLRGNQYGSVAPAGWRPVSGDGRGTNDLRGLEVIDAAEALPVIKPAALRFSGP